MFPKTIDQYGGEGGGPDARGGGERARAPRGRGAGAAAAGRPAARGAHQPRGGLTRNPCFFEYYTYALMITAHMLYRLLHICFHDYYTYALILVTTRWTTRVSGPL